MKKTEKKIEILLYFLDLKLREQKEILLGLREELIKSKRIRKIS